MVARSEIQPSMIRPPWSGFAVADAAAVPVGPGLAVGPPGVQAVATSMAAAKTAIKTLPVRCFAVMCPPLAPFALPTGFGGRVYPATHSAALAVLYGRWALAVHFSPAGRIEASETASPARAQASGDGCQLFRSVPGAS